MPATKDEGMYFGDCAIGTETFGANQFAVGYSWQTMECTDNEYLVAKNIKYFIEKANLDVKSSMQLIYDLFEQMLEV